LDRPHNAPIRISAAQRELSPGLALALALAARLWIAACRSERNWTLFVSCRFRIVSCGVVSFRSRKVSRHPTKQCMLNRPGMFWTWPGWLCLSLSLVLPGRHPPPAGTTPAHPSPPLLRRVGPDRSDRDSMDWIPGVLKFSEKPRSHNFHPPRFFRLAVDGTLIRRQVVGRNRYHRCGTRRTSGSGSVSADRRGIGYLSSAPCIVTASTMSRERVWRRGHAGHAGMDRGPVVWSLSRRTTFVIIHCSELSTLDVYIYTAFHLTEQHHHARTTYRTRTTASVPIPRNRTPTPTTTLGSTCTEPPLQQPDLSPWPTPSPTPSRACPTSPQTPNAAPKRV
jgi:hypothetical protein